MAAVTGPGAPGEPAEGSGARPAGGERRGATGRPLPEGVHVVPSILAADHARLGEEVRAAEEAGASWFQVDVMDGHFVPNISVGVPVLRSLRAATDAFLDVHLMVERPARLLPAFVEAGADLVTVHAEACVHLHRDLQEIRRLGARAGVAINPATPASAVAEVLALADLALVMTVDPGFGGQEFIRAALRKVTQLRRMADELGLRRLHVQVDGGVTEETVPLAVEAGATSLVAGSAVFRGEGTVADRVLALRRAASIQV